MASQVTNYKCPACDGALHFVGSSGRLECDYCGCNYSVEEIEKLLQEENAKAAAAMAESGGNEWDMGGMSEDWGNGSQKMKSYECPSCGAELICDETTAATCCPYCGNQTVVPGQFSGALKPEFVIPFKTDKEQAKAALSKHYKGKKLLPKSFVADNHIEDIQGVYVPFWMFDCEAVGTMTFEASNSHTERRGNKEITTTEHYDVKRGGRLAFEKVPVDASSKMPDGHMDSIEPYDYGELKDFSMAYMPGFLADKYDEDADVCGARMEKRCIRTFEDKLEETVSEYDHHTVMSKDTSVKKGAAHYAMLPVWLLATKWNDQNFLFAMNGQTGKLVGDLPLDKKKYWTYFGGISAILVLLMQILNNFVFKKPMVGFTMAVVCIALPILIGLIAVSVMKGQLKSVTEQKAAAYIAGTGLKLTLKKDNYVRTTTETKTVDSGNSGGSGK